MSEPLRLQEESGNDLELMLLRSARDDQPPPQSRRRTLEALGLAGGIVGVGATVTTTTAASTAIATASNLAFLQWISVGIVAGILAVGGIDQITRGESPPERRPASPSQVEQPARAPVAPAGRSALDHAASIDDPAATPSPLPAGEPAAAVPVAPIAARSDASGSDPSPLRFTAKPARERSAPAAAPELKPSLADEVAVLDSAREALDSSDPARALQVLEKHDKQFAAGVLSLEAKLLRIEVTLARGDRAGAIRLANEFLAAHPRSAHTSRVRSVLAAAQAQP